MGRDEAKPGQSGFSLGLHHSHEGDTLFYSHFTSCEDRVDLELPVTILSAGKSGNNDKQDQNVEKRKRRVPRQRCSSGSSQACSPPHPGESQRGGGRDPSDQLGPSCGLVGQVTLVPLPTRLERALKSFPLPLCAAVLPSSEGILFSCLNRQEYSMLHCLPTLEDYGVEKSSSAQDAD